MKFEMKSNILILACALISQNFASAQQFENYKQDIEEESIAIEMVAVSGGEFTMGAASDDYSRDGDEKPAHQVVVGDFWMGKYEITWEQYDAFVHAVFEDDRFKSKSTLQNLGIDAVSAATPPYMEMSFGMGKGTHPAVNITQYAALMYCKWLTAKTGEFYRLPTEAEWEYVCKTGNTDKVSDLKTVGWFDENTDIKYGKTGTKKANALGIHDLLGNVSEWVLDQYHSNYYAKSPKSNPWNVPTKLYPRVVRGGSWKDTADKLCCTSREKSKSDWKRRDPQIPKSNWWHTNAPFVGFRVVKPKVQPTPEQIEKYWLEAIVDYGME